MRDRVLNVAHTTQDLMVIFSRRCVANVIAVLLIRRNLRNLLDIVSIAVSKYRLMGLLKDAKNVIVNINGGPTQNTGKDTNNA
jgi:hypothetical protein